MHRTSSWYYKTLTVGIKKEKDYLIADIVALSTQGKNYQGYYGRDAIRIINAYIQILVDTMLQGFSFSIPAIGTFCIQKVKHAKIYSLAQLDYLYEISFIGDRLDNKFTKFLHAEGLIKKILFNVNFQNKDYKTAT